MEREQGYLYPHNFPRHWVQQQYLPDALKGVHYYEYGDNKTEQAAKHVLGRDQGPAAVNTVSTAGFSYPAGE